MKKFAKILGTITGTLAATIFVAVLMAFPTMWLWNWLMPEIFDLPQIGFWRALGLNLLCGILFWKR